MKKHNNSTAARLQADKDIREYCRSTQREYITCSTKQLKIFINITVEEQY